jgi:hypothetical protein
MMNNGIELAMINYKLVSFETETTISLKGKLIS